ncbi:hypothetical protein Pelo_15928 [Pelomyxa schiedti]|nr:hypothetical protein Pelo_15928 [Pelomyxa schiedti]
MVPLLELDLLQTFTGQEVKISKPGAWIQINGDIHCYLVIGYVKTVEPSEVRFIAQGSYTEDSKEEHEGRIKREDDIVMQIEDTRVKSEENEDDDDNDDGSEAEGEVRAETTVNGVLVIVAHTRQCATAMCTAPQNAKPQ